MHTELTLKIWYVWGGTWYNSRAGAPYKQAITP